LGTEIFNLLKSGIVVVGRLGRFKLGIFKTGKFNGGSEVETDEGRDNPLDCNEGNVLVELSVGRFKDGKDNGGRVGTDNGGNPVAVVVFCNPVLIGNVVFGIDKSGIPEGTPNPNPGVVLVGYDGVIDAYEVGVVIVGIADTCGTVGNDGRPGDGTDPPNVGTAAGTAPPGTDVVALGIAIPSDASIGIVGTDGTGTETGTWAGTGAG
jgi:hypothetical protein